MSTYVYRLEIPIAYETTHKVPGFLRALHVIPHRLYPDKYLEVWYECEEGADEEVIVRFYIHGTGHPFIHGASYLGTVFTHGGTFVWHVYVEKEGLA